MDQPRLYLASQSPRRAQLLRQIGVQFESVLVDVDERHCAGETPETYVKRLAQAKASAGAQLLAAEHVAYGRLVLGADTIVVKDGSILGKPDDYASYASMLGLLSGSVHEVLTAVATVALKVGPDTEAVLAEPELKLSRSRVEFKPLSTSEVQQYWTSKEPVDKAGGYAIQGIAALFVKKVEGSYSGVVGLPLYETGQLLQAQGIKTALHA